MRQFDLLQHCLRGLACRIMLTTMAADSILRPANWLRRLSRRRLRLRVMATAVAALVFAMLAFASHLHLPDEATGTANEICALCLHFERFGTTPDLLPRIALAPAVDALPAEFPAAVSDRPVLRAYRSRAPPAA